MDSGLNVEVDNHKQHPDPFLLSDSKIMTGQGKAIVCSVGKNTLLSRMRRPEDLVLKEQHTDLEQKLDLLANAIKKQAFFATFLIFVTNLLFSLLLICFSDNLSIFSNATILKVGRVFITAVVILIVAIPEGLPLAVSIAMALSIDSLKKDEILIKNIESIQTCSMVHDICVGKTGTLTKGQMHVAKIQLTNNFQVTDNDREVNPDAFNSQHEINNQLKDLVKEAIVSNTDVRIEANDEEYKYEPKG